MYIYIYIHIRGGVKYDTQYLEKQKLYFRPIFFPSEFLNLLEFTDKNVLNSQSVKVGKVILKLPLQCMCRPVLMNS